MNLFELRCKLFKIISECGGHCASNMGVCEVTYALVSSFDLNETDIIWDVGHQCYPWKMLTGRDNLLHTIRQKGGLSGFTNPEESKFDKFKSGHASTSISASIGLAESKRHLCKKGKVIAFIGDGAMTGGLAYEGLNNCSNLSNLIVILNDNSMSISKNVGAISKYLSRIRTHGFYLQTKKIAKNFLDNIPFIGKNIKNTISSANFNLRKLIFSESTIFENLGFRYYGPIDGHNVSEMIKVFNTVKSINKPVFIHIVTKKGRGYEFAEKYPEKFHGVSSFNVKTGEFYKKESETFSSVFGNTLCEIAESNKKVCAITAAMSSGTGLQKFSKKFSDRFFDVGIAESHAVTFASGLSKGGMVPIFAVYSTFLQRTFDQLIHDVSMQNLKVIFCVDRAGLIGPDGESHQGIFDIPMLQSVPNVLCYSPSYFFELKMYLKMAVDSDKKILIAIRYPKGSELFKPVFLNEQYSEFDIYGTNKKILIVTYGRLFSFASEILQNYPDKISILKLNVIIPINIEAVYKACEYENIIFFEESYKNGSISEKFAQLLILNNFRGKYKNICINGFIKHATVDEQLEECKLNYDSMMKFIDEI